MCLQYLWIFISDESRVKEREEEKQRGGSGGGEDRDKDGERKKRGEGGGKVIVEKMMGRRGGKGIKARNNRSW